MAAICAGIAEYSNVGPAMVRPMAGLLFFLTGGGRIAAYLKMALIMPEEPASPGP